jgi:hypothetical protein
MIVQKCLIRSTIGRKREILGEIDGIQPKPFRGLMEHRYIYLKSASSFTISKVKV